MEMAFKQKALFFEMVKIKRCYVMVLIALCCLYCFIFRGLCILRGGYVYYISLKGVTGASITDAQEVERNVSALRSSTNLPIVVGFGVKDGKSAKEMSQASEDCT